MPVVAAAVRLLPFPLALRLMESFAPLLLLVFRKRRTRILENLQRAFGNEKTPQELREIARQAIRNYARSITELIFLNCPERLFRHLDIQIEQEHHLKNAFEQNKGVVCASAHFGNWELMAAHLGRKGYKINAVARAVRDSSVDSWLNRTRQRGGCNVILRGKRNLELFRCLRRNELLAVLYDLDTKGSGIFVDFFGIPSHTQTGPALLALRTGAAIVPVLNHREGRYKHRLVIFPSIETGSPDEPEGTRVEKILTQLNNILESEIRKHPSEWAWMHRRWHKKPPAQSEESLGLQ